MRLRELRLNKGLTQTELGKKVGQTKSNISKYETGALEPNIETLNLLAEFFNVSIDYLLGRTDIKDPNIEKELPEEFTTPEEAIDFLLNQNVIMGYGGFDIDELDDDEKIQFANELLNQLQLLSWKYKK